ncbi:MAG: Fe3+-siderophore ABC transporter permease [Gammaproteobacteria bacterium]|nr:Fe3+-siderophore ABC transporter permease [Gammaproteobacteria bacterium]MBS04964.1 Fe3+-siderophore ABC transporter permease [Gammaproteobacteria bacterium]|tara:strand:- start:425 stop:1396 length:972 start_codon:yes stop_codon:yes gene_type:complete
MRARIIALPVLGVAMCAAVLGAALTGPVSLDLGALATDEVTASIFYDIRVPRALLAALVGAGLACAGAAIQGLFRNPLADPALIGVSGGAALFAGMAIVLGVPALSAVGIPLSAFVGGMLTTLLVLYIGRVGGTISHMLLAGIAINAVAIAGIGLMSYVATDAELRTMTFWALGSFNGATWSGVALATLIPVATVLLTLQSRGLNALTLGDAQAAHLGVSVSRLRGYVIVLTALIVGISVAIAGVIAFIGLIIPHLIRLSMSSSHYVVLPGSALAGALLLVLADTLARMAAAPLEIPVGILTALIGGPFFVFLILKQRARLGF